MGSQVTINPSTGIISGIAPAAGKYVICVCASVYRNGVLITVHRKDLIVAVNACVPLYPTQLHPYYLMVSPSTSKTTVPVTRMPGFGISATRQAGQQYRQYPQPYTYLQRYRRVL